MKCSPKYIEKKKLTKITNSINKAPHQKLKTQQIKKHFSGYFLVEVHQQVVELQGNTSHDHTVTSAGYFPHTY